MDHHHFNKTSQSVHDDRANLHTHGYGRLKSTEYAWDGWYCIPPHDRGLPIDLTGLLDRSPLDLLGPLHTCRQSAPEA